MGRRRGRGHRRAAPGADPIVKWVAYIVLVIVLALTLAAGAAGWWYIRQINPAGEAGRGGELHRERGRHAADDQRAARGRRNSSSTPACSAGTSIATVDSRSSPGYYAIQSSDHMGNMLARLRTPPNQTYSKVTFPEGFTVAEIAERGWGRRSCRCGRDGFLRAANDPESSRRSARTGITSLEGLLFPDTYQVSNGENEAQVVERMVGLMERVANQEDIEINGRSARPEPVRHPDHRLDDRGGGQARRGSPEDRPGHLQPARPRHAAADRRRRAVRHRAGWARPGQGPVRRAARDPRPVQHLPNVGLPVTPITNPGRASIHAALEPGAEPERRRPALSRPARRRGVPVPLLRPRQRGWWTRLRRHR